MAKGKIVKLRKKLKEESQKMKNEIDGIYNRESTECSNIYYIKHLFKINN